MRIYGIRPWQMQDFTQSEIEAIGKDIKQMSREGK
jgi:hypothetical protein